MQLPTYIGRFAPSPTGPLHFGSLVTAVASYCDAKANGGQWQLRIEDLDKPRAVKGAARQMIDDLEAFGFEWDGEISYQSQRNEYYQAALNSLLQQKLIYPCTCSRKEIADSTQKRGIEGVIYPKTCLNKPSKANAQIAMRIKTPNKIIQFHDEIQGEISQNLGQEIGDFVLLRADNITSYQLAVVVDDHAQGITHIVRGEDLLLSTPRQIYLQKMLGFEHPNYAHIPLVLNSEGEKLSKQTLAQAINVNEANILLLSALQFLNQNPPTSLKSAKTQHIWDWAFTHWNLYKIKQKLSL